MKIYYLTRLLTWGLFASLAQAKLLVVYLDEDPLMETRAFKEAHKEALMRRSVDAGSGRTVSIKEIIAQNEKVRLQERRIRAQQDNFVSSIPGSWKIAEVSRENGKKEEAISYIASNSVVIDIGDSDVKKAVRSLVLMPGVRKVKEEKEIEFDTFQSLDQIGATSVYESFGMGELDAGRGGKDCYC